MPRLKILVTGASGFLGQHLVSHLGSLDHQLIEMNPDLDICDETGVHAAIESAQPHAVIHLAAVASPSIAGSRPIEAWKVNVGGTFNVVQAILKSSRASKFVYIGSSESYGESLNATATPVTESAALAPLHAYGVTKATADQLVGLTASEGLTAVRLRPFNCTGPGQSSAYVISSFARQIALIERSGDAGTVRVGNLGSRRDFVDVRDMVRACSAACEADLPSGTAINISTGRPVAIQAALEHLIACSHADIRIEVDQDLVRPLDIPVCSGDATRAEKLLGWKPHITLEQTLSDVLDYWRGQI